MELKCLEGGPYVGAPACNRSQRPRKGVEVYLYFFNLGARWGWVRNATPGPLYPRETALLPTLQEAVWAPGPSWTGEENLAATAIQTPDHAARTAVAIRTADCAIPTHRKHFQCTGT
jgi:hypothetical protein